MLKRTIGVLLLVFSLCSTGRSQDDSSSAVGWKVVDFDETIDVQKDGRYVRESATTIAVTHRRALSVIGQRQLPFSESLQDLQVVEAYTLKKNGERLRVPTSAILTKNEAAGGTAGTPIFRDRKVTTIVFPNLEVGDSVYFKTKLVQTVPLFPGHFFLYLTFNPQNIWEHAKVSLTVPAGLPIHVGVAGVQGNADPTSSGETRTWTWSFTSSTPQAIEEKAVDQSLLRPHILASSFKDYGEVATAYQTRAHDKAAVTPGIQKLADEIASGITDKREQAKRLYQWVTRNIRYVAIYLESGGFVPHGAQSVLENRYGDCKDHVVLLEALLAAKGIESTPVLVDIRPNYRLPEVSIPGAFSHVITYIPSLDLYADSTNPYAPFGVLPFEDSDKPVIHTAAYKGVQRTPPTGKDNVIRYQTTISVAADGSATGELSVESQGTMSIAMRRFSSAIPASKASEYAGRALAKSGIAGDGKISSADDPKTAGHIFTFSYRAKNLLDVTGPGAIGLRPLLETTASLRNVMQSMAGPDRAHPYACTALTIVEEYEIKVPDNIKIFALPIGVGTEADFASYESRYKLEGSTLRVSRRLENKLQANVCDAARFNGMRSFREAIIADLKAQPLYRPL